MKKLFLSMTALIMVFVSVFTLLGCAPASTSEEKITKTQYMQAYRNTAKEIISVFSNDDEYKVVAGGEFAHTVNTLVTNESYSVIEHRKTADGELVTESVLYYKSNEKTRNEIAVKEVDGTVFFKLVKEEISNYEYIDVDDNYMLESSIQNTENKEEWHLGKNENGYYVAVKTEYVEAVNDEKTVSQESRYKYYATEEEYKNAMQYVLNLIENNLDELIMYSEDRSNVASYSKNGNKYVFEGNEGSLHIGDDYRSCYNYMYKDTVQELKSVQKNYEYRNYVKDQNVFIINEVIYKNETGNLKLDSFNGYIEDSTLDISDLSW